MLNTRPIEFASPRLDAKGAIAELILCEGELVTLVVRDAIFEFIRIPEGSFAMGSHASEVGSRENERPVHDVQMSAFAMGRTPVTQAQWTSITGQMPRCSPKNRDPLLPVVNVWLDEAIQFCRQLSSLASLAIGLPSEAEWEYACRAGTSTPFNLGACLSSSVASFNSDPSADKCRLVIPGSFASPNRFGLHDMHGNVWEWCADTWHENYEGSPHDGRPWVMGGDAGYCVQRGGSWRSPCLLPVPPLVSGTLRGTMKI